ncbi:hypothetical protein FC831_14505 [Clostridium botulinum]|uniref:hypothetical protein n=1 Tax=Clostridium botulinum TaxID=1491 RepID=UPI00058A4FEF|nr:hypothetical protein [Clostridium botulinum]KAI3344449.1 hypothetical protein CIT17_16890 [Clostridium botulinum]KON13490.1 hypothetical protein ACP50_05315 [Clostridium botulinum]MBY6921871.1 hypothetical protein [Clostridium botulinum]MBY6987862.1 hypothetical protein [Clostridium botulinum]NFH01464.1 hypothetical protein [Clostridium botulinum]
MINVSRAVNDPRISEPFKVFRKSGEWIKGRFIQEEKEIGMSGVIVPATNKEIEMIPEGDRTKGEISIHTTKELYTTHSEANEEGTSDEIEWEGERYKIYSLGNYKKYGYWFAIGMRLVSN